MPIKKKPEIYFENHGGYGPLAIYWFEGPYGDAVEATRGSGIGFMNQSGELLAVQFDSVESKADQQVLFFKGGWSVSIKVKAGKLVKIFRQKKEHPGRHRKAA